MHVQLTDYGRASCISLPLSTQLSRIPSISYNIGTPDIPTEIETTPSKYFKTPAKVLSDGSGEFDSNDSEGGGKGNFYNNFTRNIRSVCLSTKPNTIEKINERMNASPMFVPEIVNPSDIKHLKTNRKNDRNHDFGPSLDSFYGLDVSTLHRRAKSCAYLY